MTTTYGIDYADNNRLQTDSAAKELTFASVNVSYVNFAASGYTSVFVCPANEVWYIRSASYAQSVAGNYGTSGAGALQKGTVGSGTALTSTSINYNAAANTKTPLVILGSVAKLTGGDHVFLANTIAGAAATAGNGVLTINLERGLL